MAGVNIYSELLAAQLENVASDPATILAQGRVVFRSDTKKGRLYNGSVWTDLGGGGGGGSSIVWMPNDSGLAPAEQFENNIKTWMFGPGETQTIFTIVKVPTSYAAGSQILMRIGAYSPSTGNSFLLQSLATLIRAGTDAVTSTTNQRTSTNAAQANGTANLLRVIQLDLTSTIGQINGTAVAAGDLIKVQLSRAVDTDTDYVRFIPISTEVTS